MCVISPELIEAHRQTRAPGYATLCLAFAPGKYKPLYWGRAGHNTRTRPPREKFKRQVSSRDAARDPATWPCGKQDVTNNPRKLYRNLMFFAYHSVVLFRSSRRCLSGSNVSRATSQGL